jgi:hypothetical protein
VEKRRNFAEPNKSIKVNKAILGRGILPQDDLLKGKE